MSQQASAPATKPNALVRAIPILGWLPQYKKAWLGPDLLAGLSVWALVVPQALAYAAVVGVPAQYGLYTILGASVLYAVFASTRQVVTGPSASVAAVTAPVAALFVAANSPDYLSTVIALTLAVESSTSSWACCAWAGYRTSSPRRSSKGLSSLSGSD